MRPLSARELLTVWEWGVGRRPVERGLVLLAATCPDEPVERLLHQRIGERDVNLTKLRALTFGSHLECQATCPECSQRLELSVATGDLMSAMSSDQESTDCSGSSELLHEGWRIRIRSVETEDLLVATAAEARMTRRVLLDRCVLSATAASGIGVPPDGLPEQVEAALMLEMQRLDSASNLTFALNCPDCQHAWSAPFDILQFFWREIDAWALRTLREVHALASAYGWTEETILALSGWRREAYLQLAGNA